MMGFEATTPMVAPFGSNTQRPDHWKHFDDSVNAVSFGFVATAILISMFLLLAIFERFLRQRSSEANNVATPMDLEHQMHLGGKLENLSSKCKVPILVSVEVNQMTIYGRGVLVLMPGEQIPSFIALPSPAPCSRQPMSWPIQVQHNSCFHAPLALTRNYNLTSN
ncbi:hypothetical protein JHK87_016791 [Glycine soja]|nr:hypothetical protein JHK87_016791 [Glycine soja]